jgi:hypothetical protein
MGHLLEELGVATLVGMQPQGPRLQRARSVSANAGRGGEHALLAIGLFELWLRGIGGDVEKIVKFSLDDEDDVLEGRGDDLRFLDHDGGRGEVRIGMEETAFNFC